MLGHRFGQSATIIQALKSSVTDETKIRAGDNAALLDLPNKIESSKGARGRVAKEYWERSNGREPGLKEFSKFIAAQPLIENGLQER